jgi:hypothetical protein
MGTPGAEQLWIEVEDPALSAGNAAITVDGQPVTTVDTALGVAAVVTPATKDNHVTIGVSVAADPDIAFTAVNAAGTALYTEHYRTGMTAARPQSSRFPRAHTHAHRYGDCRTRLEHCGAGQQRHAGSGHPSG